MYFENEWEDVFYIENMNDGSYPHRPYTDNKWYVLRLRPNSIRNESRHSIIACGIDLNKILETVSKYVSTYQTSYAMYNSFDKLPDGCRLGYVSLAQVDEHYKYYHKKSNIRRYTKAINKAIKIGKQNVIYKGDNVYVRYCKQKEEIEISGYQCEWFENFVDKIMQFDGYTKVDLYKRIKSDVDFYCLNEIFGVLKQHGYDSIGKLKKLDMYQWIDILAPLVNEWDFSE